MVPNKLINNKEEEHELSINYDILKKVKLGNCYNYNEIENPKYPFYISFDDKTLNYHIVPEERKDTEYMKKILESLKNKLISNDFKDCKITHRGKKSRTGKIDGSVIGGSTSFTKNHKWIEIVSNQISFLLEFQTLSFDGDTLNCYLDEIQFVAYPNLEKLNYFSLNGDLHIMYPKKGKDIFCLGNNRVVYNTEFNCQSCSDKVAEEFIKFIKKINEFNEEDSSPKVYSPNK